MSNKPISFRIDEETYTKLEAIATKNNQSIGQLMKDIAIELALVDDLEAFKNADKDIEADNSDTIKKGNESKVENSEAIKRENKLIEILQSELEAKNNQIRDLQNLLNQEQSLHLNLQRQLPLIEATLDNKPIAEEEPLKEKQTGFFRKFFKK